MKVDPFAPQLLIDFDIFCRKFGPYPFGDYMARWYAAQALIEATQEEGGDPFDLTPEDLARCFPDPVVN